MITFFFLIPFAVWWEGKEWEGMREKKEVNYVSYML